MSNKEKILFCGDTLSGPLQTGLAYVITSFMKRFDLKKYEIAYCTLTNSDSNPQDFHIHGKDFEDKFKNMKIYNCQIRGDSCTKFSKMVDEWKPNILVSVTDPWNLDPIAYTNNKSKFFWVHYMTVETDDYPDLVMCPTKIIPTIRKSIKDILSRCNLVIPVTEYGKNYCERLGIRNYSEENIFNGLDVEDRCSKKLSKSKVFRGILKEDCFLFMTMGRNTARKQLYLVIESFKHFLDNIVYLKRNPNDYRLYIHTDINDTGTGTDLLTLVNKLGISSLVIFPMELNKKIYFSKKHLYERYSVCDCYIGLPGAEGFGYGFAEAMLHNKPIIYSDYGGHTTYCKGIPIPIKKYIYTANFCVQWGLVDPKEVSREMFSVATMSKEKREKISEGNFEFVRDNLDWDKHIFPKFLGCIEKGYKNFKKQTISSFNLKRIV